jgi:hypothetical protein
MLGNEDQETRLQPSTCKFTTPLKKSSTLFSPLYVGLQTTKKLNEWYHIICCLLIYFVRKMPGLGPTMEQWYEKVVGYLIEGKGTVNNNNLPTQTQTDKEKDTDKDRYRDRHVHKEACIAHALNHFSSWQSSLELVTMQYRGQAPCRTPTK